MVFAEPRSDPDAALAKTFEAAGQYVELFELAWAETTKPPNVSAARSMFAALQIGGAGRAAPRSLFLTVVRSARGIPDSVSGIRDSPFRATRNG